MGDQPVHVPRNSLATEVSVGLLNRSLFLFLVSAIVASARQPAGIALASRLLLLLSLLLTLWFPPLPSSAHLIAPGPKPNPWKRQLLVEEDAVNIGDIVCRV